MTAEQGFISLTYSVTCRRALMCFGLANHVHSDSISNTYFHGHLRISISCQNPTCVQSSKLVHWLNLTTCWQMCERWFLNHWCGRIRKIGPIIWHCGQRFWIPLVALNDEWNFGCCKQGKQVNVGAWWHIQWCRQKLTVLGFLKANFDETKGSFTSKKVGC